MNENGEFTFQGGDSVAIGDFYGTVRGGLWIMNGHDSYLIAYVNEHGKPVEEWFPEYAITKVTKH